MPVTVQPPETVCAECGAVLQNNETVCPQCGCPVAPKADNAAEPAAAVICAECGAVLQHGETVCRACGAPVEPPAAVSAPIRDYVDPDIIADERARKRFVVYNIYGLLTVIPSTILFMGKIFTLKTADKSVPFGFMDFSEKNESIGELLNLLKGVDGGFFDEMRELTAGLGLVKFVFIAMIIFFAITFFKGWLKVGSGKFVPFVFFAPATYCAAIFIFMVVQIKYLFNPINNFLNENLAALFIQAAAGKMNITLEVAPPFVVLFIFAAVNCFLIMTVDVVEDHIVYLREKRARKKQK